ncbi:MAG: amidohydrolase [Nevskiaceae bacterium]|nr:MAG: amidohydrolase [Burkholderiaceae bacterium]TBR72368.1 MAG: amidohydrolase [Nevskiaceae bacterium]
MQDLKISIVQGATRWRDPAANHDYYAALCAPLQGTTDLVILPETFTSGFSNEAIHNAETMDGPTVAWLHTLATRLGAAVTGSVQLRDGDRVYNRLLFATPEGALHHYDKRHLFRYADEHKRYAPGGPRLVVEYRGWKICPLVCYDLRFPVFLRNGYTSGGGFDYDLALFVANWPDARTHAWRTLLRARAIENLCYCAGVNRTGTDGNQISYPGNSAVLDHLGQPLVELGGQEQAATVTLDAAALAAFRQHFPAWMDADPFALR